MEAIAWGPAFSVGVERLDQQHRRIVETINALVLHPGTTVRSEMISELLSHLTQYANEHFVAEEQLLEEHGYPGLAGQKAEHKAYRAKLVAFCQAAIKHEDSVPAELLDYVREWWVNHILVTDMAYRVFLTERGVA